jgi:Zn-dependent protease
LASQRRVGRRDKDFEVLERTSVQESLFGISIYSIISFLCFIPAIVLHEVSHGLMANRLGDPTAKSKGRLSLNPLRHVDPFGSVILPIALTLFGGPVFGYAKPVPYNPRYFKNIRMGEFLTGFAGPACNVILACLSAIVAFLVFSFLPIQRGNAVYWTLVVCQYFSLINLYLAFFNLIPIPPLDGASIIALFLSDKALRQYYRIQQYALPALLVIMFVLPSFLGVNPISWYLSHTAGALATLLFGFL